MVTPYMSIVIFVFPLLFINIASDWCMKLETMNVVGLSCHIDNNNSFFVQIVVVNVLTLIVILRILSLVR